MRERTAGPMLNGAALALLVAAVAACYGFGISLFGQLVPDMRRTMGFDYGFVGTVAAGVQFATLFGLVAAWLTPRIGSATVVVAATVVSGGGLLVVAATADTRILAAALLVMGASAAAVFVPMIDLVARLMPPPRRGFGMSLTSSGTAYGVIFGAALVPALAGGGGEGWRAVWAVGGTLTLLCAALLAAVFHRLGLFHAAPDGTRPQDDAPTLPPGVLPWVLILWTLSALNGFATYPFQNYLSGYLREELGFSITYAGVVWGAIGVVGMVSGFAVGALSQRHGVRTAILFCYAALLSAGLALTLAPVGLVPVLSGALFALGFYPVFGLLPAFAALHVGVRSATLIFGVSNVVQGLGGAAGNPLGVAARDATGSFAVVYLAFTAVAAVACALAFALPRGGRR